MEEMKQGGNEDGGREEEMTATERDAASREQQTRDNNQARVTHQWRAELLPNRAPSPTEISPQYTRGHHGGTATPLVNLARLAVSR